MTTTTTDPLAAVLEVLEPRQVANDKLDRDHWLRTRLTGITATEAKVLHKGSTREKSDVVKKKIEGDDFRGNKYTDWGSYREAHLLELAAATEYGWLVHAPGNERHLATPDGLRKTWDGFAVIECKTSKHDISLGSPNFESYGYLWQILWQMYCAGTDEAYYVWERHDDDWSRWSSRPMDRPEEWAEYGPTPVEAKVHHIVMTPELKAELEKMVAAANRALGRLDKKVAELRAERAENPVEELSEEEAAAKAEAEHAERLHTLAMETQAKIYRNALEDEKLFGEKKVTALATLLELAGKRWGDDTGEHEFSKFADEETPLLRIGYSPESVTGTSSVDEVAAKEANGPLWEQLEAARVAYEALRDQWTAAAANHTKTGTKTAKAKVTVTEKKGK